MDTNRIDWVYWRTYHRVLFWSGVTICISQTAVWLYTSNWPSLTLNHVLTALLPNQVEVADWLKTLLGIFPLWWLLMASSFVFHPDFLEPDPELDGPRWRSIARSRFHNRRLAFFVIVSFFIFATYDFVDKKMAPARVERRTKVPR